MLNRFCSTDWLKISPIVSSRSTLHYITSYYITLHYITLIIIIIIIIIIMIIIIKIIYLLITRKYQYTFSPARN